MQIEGKNAVSEALASGKKLDKLFVAKGVRGDAAQSIIDTAREQGVRVDFVDAKRLDRMSVTGKHQGFVGVAQAFAYTPFEELPTGLTLVLDGIEDPHNLGAIIRVAECGGVTGIVIPDRRSATVNETVVRVAAGATASVAIARVTNLNDAIRKLKDEGVTVIGAELGGDGLWESDLSVRPLALVIGSEGHGLHRLTRELCDGIVTIPMYGHVNSLNVSTASAVIINEAKRGQMSKK